MGEELTSLGSISGHLHIRIGEHVLVMHKSSALNKKELMDAAVSETCYTISDL